MASVPAFQAGYAGSIPVTRSKVWCVRSEELPGLSLILPLGARPSLADFAYRSALGPAWRTFLFAASRPAAHEPRLACR
jgi:hypothetical protein